MKFTYESYQMLINLLKDNNYTTATYENYKSNDSSVILRHDIDYSPSKALEFSKIEQKNEVISTWFVLFSTDFYNSATSRNRAIFHELAANGSEIGLHFDEKQYTDELYPLLKSNDLRAYREVISYKVHKEADMLSNLIDLPIKAVSMHRPSNVFLEQNLTFDNLTNTYSKEFFVSCKYLSDSRRFWREPVEEVISSGIHKHLHILTHAFWYNYNELSIHDSISKFVLSANLERYLSYSENFSDLNEVLKREEIE